MDGRQKSADIVREVRRLANLTQRDLARLARVPQPTVSAIESAQREPSLSLLSSLVEAAGLSLHVTVTPPARWSAVMVARHLAEILRESKDPRRSADSALRTVLSFRDVLQGMSDLDCRRLVDDPPTLVGDSRWDAFLAATVEHECARRDQPPPRWVNSPARFVKPFWHVSNNPALHQWEFESAPAAFLRHGVVVAAVEMASV